MAIQLQPEERDIRRIVQSVIQLNEGRHNAFDSVTLTPGAALTVVSHPNCGLDSVVLLSPRTANAAAALATTYVSAVDLGSFTLTHANNAQVDRIFDYTCGAG
jgi:hypothetical protein